MVFQEDIIVNIRYTTKDEEKGIKAGLKVRRNIEILGDKIKTTTSKFIGHRKAIETITTKMRGFRMELLSVMFFGMALQRIFKGLTATSMEWMGVNDILGAFLGITFLPIAEAFSEILFKIWDIFDALPEPVKYLINAFVLVVGVIGALLAAFGTLGLGLAGLKMAGILPMIAALGPLIPLILAIIAVIGILWWAWSTNFLGIRDITAKVFDWIKGYIKIWIDFFRAYITSFLDFFKAIWEGRWTDAANIVFNVFKNIKDFIWNLGGYFWNAARNLLIYFIDGLWSLVGQIREALWNILPQWLKNIISGIGGIASYVGGVFKGLLGMQAGGIVTKPTPALIGERGPEAVIPLDRIGSIGGINVTINTTTIGGNVDQLARELAEKFSFELGRVRY